MLVTTFNILSNKSKNIIILASGESIKNENLSIIPKDFIVIAVNDTYQLYPDADILYACDAVWWRDSKPDFNGLKLSISYSLDNVELLKTKDENNLKGELDKEFPYIRTGKNSGYQAINVAYHLHPKNIILVGYDMCGGHFNSDRQCPYNYFIPYFETLPEFFRRENIRIINASPISALNMFEKTNNLKEALDKIL